jgi:hypothetical protein
MGILKKISDYFSSTGTTDEAGYWVYVRCNKCQEPLKTRINLHHDLSVNYDDPRGQTFFSRKTIVGSQGCFERIKIELTFNNKRKLISKEISGGTFIDRDDYLMGVEPG